jgi:regulatory protein
MTDTSQILKYAIHYLSKFNSSKNNLERILRNKIKRMKIEKKDKFFLHKSIPEIILKLEKNKLIDDINYASSKIRLFISNGKSRIFIKNYLLQKGIDSTIISKLLEKNDQENLDWEIESARIFVRKKIFSKKIKDKEKNFSKMSRAGFNYGVSKKILDEI